VKTADRGACSITEITWLERDRWSTVPHVSRVPNVTQCVAPLAARFEGQGADLVLVVSIRAEEAEHGAMISVPAPGTTVRLRVPPGTKSGRRFRLPRANAPAPDGFGDLKVMVEVVGLTAVTEV
jgi:DnaJ-class molecular chaperone